MTAGAGRTAAVSAVVLAGGRSSRFAAAGGGSKLDADLRGRTVLGRTIDAVAGVAGEVLVVGRSAVEASASGEAGRALASVRAVPDAAPFEGPLAGLAAGLAAVSGEVVLVVGGDTPLVRPAILRLLLERLAAGLESAVALEVEAAPRPLPMALRREPALDHARAVLDAGDRSLRRLLDGLTTVVVPEAEWRALDARGDSVLDVDLPADLEAARERLGG